MQKNFRVFVEKKILNASFLEFISGANYAGWKLKYYIDIVTPQNLSN